MARLEAVFENGVFRPLQPVELAEHQRGILQIDEHGGIDSADQAQFASLEDRWQAFCDALDAPAKSIPALKRLLTDLSVLEDRNQ
jgi:predicted DNA-binding antitoxin AbrB/MazE fold protein